MRDNSLINAVWDELKRRQGRTIAGKADDTDDGKPIHHKKLEAVRRHVMDSTSTHKDANDKFKALVEAHKALYDKDGNDDDGDKTKK